MTCHKEGVVGVPQECRRPPRRNESPADKSELDVHTEHGPAEHSCAREPHGQRPLLLRTPTASNWPPCSRGHRPLVPIVRAHQRVLLGRGIHGYAWHNLPFPYNNVVIPEKTAKPQRPTLPFKIFTNSTFVALNFKARVSHLTQLSTIHPASLKVNMFTNLQNTCSASSTFTCFRSSLLISLFFKPV